MEFHSSGQNVIILLNSTVFFCKNTFIFYSVGYVLISHPLLVIPVSYPCHYTELCPDVTKTHTLHVYTYINLDVKLLIRMYYYQNQEKTIKIINKENVNYFIRLYFKYLKVLIYVLFINLIVQQHNTCFFIY